jgi:hypothetical protein
MARKNPFDNVSRRLRGHEAKERDAREAQDIAANTFLRMDTAHRDLQLQVESFLVSGADPAAARRLESEYQQLHADAEFRAQRYLATLDAHPVGDTTPLDKLYSATMAYRQATGDLSEMAAKLEAFLEKNIPLFAKTTSALDQLGSRRQRANARLEEARAAVAALAEAGIPVEEAGAALDRAEAVAAELAAAVGQAKVPDLIELADRAAIAAEAVRPAVAQVTARAEARAREEQARREAEEAQARESAEAEAAEARARAEAEAREAAARAEEEARRAAELAALAEAAPKRVASLRTRRDAVAFRAEKAEETLRVLRREWSEGNWADVVDTGPRVAEQLAAADVELASAADGIREQNWPHVEEIIRSLGDRLTAATELLDNLMNRHDLLVAARDGSAELVAQARFRLRDAQRLVMTGRTEPPQPWAGELDALAVRLDAAAEILDGVHPNYWAYRAELAAITDAVADVVRRYNASGTASA